MKTDEQLVVELGHASDKEASLAQRVRQYRALANTTAVPAIAAHFHRCADELAATEEKIGQRTLDFMLGESRGNGS